MAPILNLKIPVPVLMIVLTSMFVPRLSGQACDCSVYPTYKCIESNGRTLAQLISDSDLEDYDDAPGEIQYIVVKDEINFYDPSDPRPYVFASGSQIFMLPGSVLAIRKEVVFNEVSMFGCITPWTGIQVYASGILRLSGSGIANACEGVILSPNSSAEIALNAFANNGICIQASGSVNLLGKGIAHNTFNGNNYSITPCFGVNTRSALVLNNVSHITIGNPSGVGIPNHFINYYGIFAANTNIDVYNTRFEERPGGAGILLRGNGAVYTANIFGLGSNETDTPFIKNYQTGVNARNYNLNIANAYFLTSGIVGMIRVEDNSLPSRLAISNNRFEDFNVSAINISKSTFRGANIKENKFFDGNDTSIVTSGIRWLTNNLVGSNAGAEISDNHFFDEEKTNYSFPGDHFDHTGIVINESSGMNIEYNTFYQNYDTEERHDFRGVRLNMAFGNEITNNSFYGYYGPSVHSNSIYQGISARESGYNLIACNQAEGLNQGFYFWGPACDQTVFRNNTMEENLTGLQLGSGAIIGAQFEHENKWPGTLPGGGVAEAYFEGNPGQGLVSMSRFWINSSNQNSTLWASPRIPSDDWFVPTDGEDSQTLNCYRTLPLPPSVSDELVIDEEFEAYKGYPGSEWEAALRAFSALDNNPGLLGGATPADAFYEANDTANIGKLYRAMKDWHDIKRLTTGFESDWNTNMTAIGYKLDTVAAQVAVMETAPDTLQAGIALELAALYEDLAGLQEDNMYLAGEYLADVADRAGVLAADLGAINAVEPWEQNLLKVLTIFAERLQDTAETEWTIAHYDTLLSIADQCRHEGGIGVVWARAAIGQFDYDDEEMCPGYFEEIISAVGTPGRLEATVWPNPATGHCRVIFDQPLSGTLVLRNLNGQVVKSIQVSKIAVFDLDIQNLPSGLYLLEVSTPEIQQLLTKLVIFR